MAAEKPIANAIDGFFEIRLSSIAANLPLAFDLYLLVNSKPTLFRKRGDTLTPDRLKQLSGFGATSVLVPDEQRSLYSAAFRAALHDPGTDMATKGRVMKEAAFVKMGEFFSSPNLQATLEGTETIVKDLVSFISSDSGAAASMLQLSSHDNYTYNHSVNVAVYSVLLAKKLGGADPNATIIAGMSALLHDIGKRNIPPAILTKMSPLTPEENALMRKHPELGAKLLESVPAVTAKVREVVVQHHERFDGSGYPFGLKGEQIARLARVVAIADVFDALTTERVGQKPFTPQDALNLMATLSGKFDPAIFKNFHKAPSEKLKITLRDDFDPCSCQLIHVVSR